VSAPWHRDGRLHFAVGIEDTFVPQSAPGARAIDEYELTEHYERFAEDFALAKNVGADLVRWGVPWYRIQPGQSEWDFGWLDRAMDRFAELELTPVVDLMHYGTPLWLDAQFAHPDYPQRVADYSARVAERYEHLGVMAYTPVNEPMIHALFSGDYAYWPPYLSGEEGLSTMIRQLSRGFVLAQRAMADVLGEGATFVHVDAGMRYVGDVEAEEHVDLVHRLRHQVHLVEDLVVGKASETHALFPFLRENGWSDDDFAFFAQDPQMPDVMGINYYPRHSTEVFEAGIHHAGGFADPRPTRDDGLEGLEELVRHAADRFGAPVMITETCVTGTIAERIAWMRESVEWSHQVRHEGVDLVGYTWWPLFDMYEWTWRHTLNDREAHRLTMGLWELVESDHGLLRQETAAAQEFLRLACASPSDFPVNKGVVS